MWGIAGARSMRRLIAVHLRASQPPRPNSPCLTTLSRPEEGGRERASAHSPWMGTLYDNHQHFPSEYNTQESLPELDAQPTRAYGANFVWGVWSHAPLKLLSRPPEASRSRSLPPLRLLHFLLVKLIATWLPLAPAMFWPFRQNQHLCEVKCRSVPENHAAFPFQEKIQICGSS